MLLQRTVDLKRKPDKPVRIMVNVVRCPCSANAPKVTGWNHQQALGYVVLVKGSMTVM